MLVYQRVTRSLSNIFVIFVPISDVESPLRRWGNHVWKPRRVQIQVMEIFTRSNPKISEGFESYAATVSTELSQ